MSFSGSDDVPCCDVCIKEFVYDACVPWPRPGADGRPPRDLFAICTTCLQNLILEGTRGPARQLAHASASIWQEHQALLRDAETAVRAASRRIQDERNEWNEGHDAEAARRRQQEEELAAQFRRELDGLDEITGRS